MSLVETVESGVGQWTRGVDVEEESECKTNGFVVYTFVFVLVCEFEVEDDSVVVVVRVFVIG